MTDFSKIKNAFSDLLIILVIMLAVFILIEAFFRIKTTHFDANKTIYEKALTSDVEPAYIVFHMKGNFRSKELNTNSQGFRAKEFGEYGDKGGKYRILIFGGSVTYGWFSSSDSATIARHLEEKLNKRYNTDRFEVVNLGYPSYVSNQELILFLLHGINLNPDMVITLDGYNDIIVGLGEQRIGDPCGFSIFSKLYKLANGEMEYVPYALIKGSRFLSYSKYVFNSGIIKLQKFNRSKKNPKFVKPEPEIVKYYVDNLRKLSLAARDISKAEYIMVLQPVLYMGKKLTEPESRIEKACFLECDAVTAMFHQARAEMKDMAEKERVVFIDATTVFSGQTDTIFLDNAHLTDKGNEIVAEKIAGEIQSFHPDIINEKEKLVHETAGMPAPR